METKVVIPMPVINWSEETIRAEMERLDAVTGLSGAKLPIRFNNSKKTLGQYNSADGGSFRFSNYYYHDPDWPIEDAVDTIRHEYAHYMDHVLYGKIGHGTSWKQCCMKIRALPIRFYSTESSEYYREKHKKEQRQDEKYDRYAIGSVIKHPTFGVGTIEAIIGESLNRCISVRFEDIGTKILGLGWVDRNCIQLIE